ncbi:CYP38, partial [Symbiodinium sp. KB8]
VPAEYANLPRLDGRAVLEWTLTRGPESGATKYVIDEELIEEAKFTMVIDGWSAPLSAGNFLDLVNRKFYNGLPIQRADGFIIQTGDPGADKGNGFSPGPGQPVRTIPLEVGIRNRKEALYGETIDEARLVGTEVKIPFQADGTIALARREFDNDSASSQVFMFLFESVRNNTTPPSASVLGVRVSWKNTTPKNIAQRAPLPTRFWLNYGVAEKLLELRRGPSDGGRTVVPMVRCFAVSLALLTGAGGFDIDGCTSIVVNADAMADGSAIASHSNDCADCDWRMAYVPAKDHPPHSERIVYDAVWSTYPRIVDPSRSKQYQPGAGITASKELGRIPQVNHTYALWEASYGLMNEHGLGLGESTCPAFLVGKGVSDGGAALFSIGNLMAIALERCKTARCAIQTMGDLGAKYGFYGEDPGYGGAGEATQGPTAEEVVVPSLPKAMDDAAEETSTQSPAPSMEAESTASPSSHVAAAMPEVDAASGDETAEAPCQAARPAGMKPVHLVHETRFGLLMEKFKACEVRDESGTLTNIDMAKFFEACELYRDMLSKLGSATGFVLSDIESNLKKAQVVYEQAPEERATFSGYLKSSVVGVAWLLRGVQFFLAMIKLMFTQETGNAGVEAYKQTLMQYHGWMLQKTVKIGMRAMPGKDGIVKSDGLVLGDVSLEQRAKLCERDAPGASAAGLKVVQWMVETMKKEGKWAVTLVDRTGEAWVFHICGGVPNNATSAPWAGQRGALWVAQRVPSGHVAVIANSMIIRTVDLADKKNFMAHPGIVDLLKESGLWDGFGPLDWQRIVQPDLATFSYFPGLAPIPMYSTLRMWGVYRQAAPNSGLQATPDLGSFPFSVPVEGKATVQDVMNWFRTHYEGTEFDMRYGSLAGPWQSPNRAEGGNGARSVPGQFARSTSIPRTSYTQIVQSGPIHQPRVWFAPDCSASSVFVPFFSSALADADGRFDVEAYGTGSQKSFVFSKHDTVRPAWWAFDFVANWMEISYQNMSEQYVYTAVQSTQLRVVEETEEALRKSDKMHAKSAAKHLADFQSKLQRNITEEWWALADTLVVRYNDMFYNYPPETPHQVSDIGYPAFWLEMIGFNQEFYRPPAAELDFETLNPKP